MIRALAAAALLLMLVACGAVPAHPDAQGNRKPAPAGPPPPPMPDIAIVCPADVKLCPDGRYVSRKPANECEFDACPGSTSQ